VTDLPDGQKSVEFSWRVVRRTGLSFENPMRVKSNLLSGFKLIWVVQSPLAKIFRLTRRANHS
jgi:hypothetical protein